MVLEPLRHKTDLDLVCARLHSLAPFTAYGSESAQSYENGFKERGSAWMLWTKIRTPRTTQASTTCQPLCPFLREEFLLSVIPNQLYCPSGSELTEPEGACSIHSSSEWGLKLRGPDFDVSDFKCHTRLVEKFLSQHYSLSVMMYLLLDTVSKKALG